MRGKGQRVTPQADEEESSEGGNRRHQEHLGAVIGKEKSDKVLLIVRLFLPLLLLSRAANVNVASVANS